MLYKDTYSVGSVYITNNCGTTEVLSVVGRRKRLVRFTDTGYRVVTTTHALLSGCIKDPLHRSVLGVGFLGVGNYRASTRGVHSKAYSVWKSMMTRCYSEVSLKKLPTYLKCSVCREWHSFQIFAEWFKCNSIEGCELDKDILSGTVYSPQTCCFIPQQLNTFLTCRKATNTTGKVGVCFHKCSGRYAATGSSFCEKRKVYLGIFKTVDEAYTAYCQHRLSQVSLAVDYMSKLGYPVQLVEAMAMAARRVVE